MKERDSFRGTSIDETFAESFKKTRFYRDIYYENKNDIIIGVRDSFINLYYNCDSIALIDVDKPGQCKIDSYYTNGEKKVLDENQYVSYFDIIKETNKRSKLNKGFSLTITTIHILIGSVLMWNIQNLCKVKNMQKIGDLISLPLAKNLPSVLLL